MASLTSRTAVILMFLCTLFASTAHLFLKYGAGKIRTDNLMTIVNLPLTLGLAFFGIGAILMLAAFRKGELSVLFPILATSYVWISLLAPLFFVEESINLWKGIGIILILISVSLLGINSTKASIKGEGS